MSKDANYIKLINTTRWRQLRLKKLQAQPLCECDECTANEKITPATEVHHIVPVESVNNIEQMETLMFAFKNLMSVSHECHVKIHQEMFSHSKVNVKKANEKRTKRFIDKYL
ncbi:HNH endonuclease signature motif containing protein [Dysgonomonas sp. GY617]|uniref:HNH endonuclease signature motif containing protein n=1 Tax=Dysgonomonas sp. GY617 TaxID=2780420 RepID=UPI0018839A10|nr:HNH endonuclease signature motif containing protein [Dysgonomonas sp. GY617]MBF0577728.1 HNH endonuclease [Dysgonomonas sp. GY617]